jgi:hypothetical protein
VILTLIFVFSRPSSASIRLFPLLPKGTYVPRRVTRFGVLTLESDRFLIFSEFLSEKYLIARYFLTVIARELIYAPNDLYLTPGFFASIGPRLILVTLPAL